MNLDEIAATVRKMKTAGLKREDAQSWLSAQPDNGYDEPEAHQLIDQLYEESANGHYNLTDYGNAERFAHQHGASVRYCHEWKQWLIWNGKGWQRDASDIAISLAKQTVREIYIEAGNEPDKKQRDAIAAHAKASETDHKLTSMLHLAQTEPGIPITSKELNTGKYLLNCQNGTVDLRTGLIRQHSREDYITEIAPYEYLPNAEPTVWLKFLYTMTGGDAELMRYIQQAVGVSLTADVSEQIWWYLYGLGSNGKSTFITTLLHLANGYGYRSPATAFMLHEQTRKSDHSESIANLKGKRLVASSEVQDGQKLDCSLMKDLTGGDIMTARNMYQGEQSFQPTWHIWMFGNHKPIIHDSTNAQWRRLKLAPCNTTIKENEKDKYLDVKLQAELGAIFTWAVKGAMDWQANGLIEPEAVKNATAAYRTDSDALGDFISEHITEPGASVSKKQFKQNYIQWCTDHDVEPLKQTTFKAKLMERGITENRTKREWRWIGIRLKTAMETQNVTDITTGKDNSEMSPGDKILALGDNPHEEPPQSTALIESSQTLCSTPSSDLSPRHEEMSPTENDEFVVDNPPCPICQGDSTFRNGHYLCVDCGQPFDENGNLMPKGATDNE